MCAGDKIYGSEERSMFQALIDQAHAMIQRLYACAEKGRNDVPLADRRAMLLGEARRSDVKRGEFFGLIDYFNLAIGVLREYDAAYQCELNSTNLPAREPTDAPADLAPMPAHEQLQQPASQDQFDEPEVVRRVDQDRWEVVISVDNNSYDWLFEMAAVREPTKTADGAAVARLAATIIERVAAQTQRSRERGGSER